MDVANLLVPSVPHSAYLVSVSNTTVTYGSSGSIVMSISPASSYNYKYDFYLKVYDSKGNEKINQRYYSTSSSYQVTYSISSNQLDPGNYIIKIINNHEGYIMSTANLTVISVPYDAYSVSVPYTTITYGIGGEITMNINPASSSYKCRYDFYMKVYDSNNNEKISKRYYSTSTNTQVTYNIGSTQLENGNYKIKIINTYDNHVMATANLTVKTLTYNEYSVNVSDTTLISEFSESIIMNISPASSYNYKYDFYLNLYDSNGNQKISQRYYSTYSYTQVTYTVGANQFEPGNYTIRITNTYDNHTMATANLTVKTLTYDTYSVNVSDSTITYGFVSSIVINITPSSPTYQGKYDYYLVIYDSYGSEQIYERVISSSNPQPTYYINTTQLTPGKYTIRIFNYYDGKIMDTADLTVIALNYTSYSANVFNTTITYGIGGNIVMNITPASQIYQGKYDYYLVISDSNNFGNIRQRYYSTVPNTQETYNINPTQLKQGHYKINLINAYDDYILATANLTVLSVPHNAYSVNVQDIIINYEVSSSIVMNITPASSQYNYKYDFYLKLYDSQGNEKISQQYYSTTSNTQITYDINSYQLSPGNYTIKLLNNIDNYTMDSSNLTVIALTYDSYSVNVSGTEIAYGTAGSIIMNITPASSIYYKKYDYYLRIYDSDGTQKINQRYYNTNPNTQETYNIKSTQLNPGNYKIELVNYYDYKVMDTANLTISSVPYSAYSINIQDNTITYENGGSIVMNITSNSNSYYKYDFYLEIYDSIGYKKISQRYYSTSSKTQETYKINPKTLNRGSYTIKILNNVDNHIMDSAKLYVIQSPNFEISSQDCNVGKIAKIDYTINSEATGNLSIFVNSDFVKNVSVGQPINFANLTEGEYTVKVVYTSDNYFASSEDTTQFEVFKCTPNFKISANDIIADDYEFFNTCIIAGNNVTFKFIFDSDATGVANITFEKYGNYSCELVNGVATVFISNIKAWDYTYTINYTGDYKYNPFECEGQINIEYKSNSIDFEVPRNITWGDSIIITPILPEDISPTFDDLTPTYVMVLLYYPGEEDILFSDRMSVGESYNLTVLYGGNLVISLWTPGDDYYGIGTASKEIYVNKLNTTCNIPDAVEAGYNVPATVTLNEDARGNVGVSIGNEWYYGALINGTFSFNISNIKHGIYNVTIHYYGDTKYNAFELTKTLNVTYKKSDVNLTLKNILVGENIYIAPNVTIGATGYVDIYYDNNPKSTIKVNSSYPLTKPEIGKHEIRVVYRGDSYFASCEKTEVFRVFARYPIEATDMEILYKSGNYFNARFYDEYGNYLSNKMAIFNINGTNYPKMTNEYGVATLDLDLPIGYYEVNIINPTVNENTKRNLLVFSSIKSKDMSRAYNSGVDFNATFLDSNAKPLSGSYVLFKVNGVDYPAFTDINGVALLNVPLAVGTYTVISINTETNENITNKLNIVPSIQANNMSRAYNSSMDYKAKFFDKNNNPLINTEVTFLIGSNTYRNITNDIGEAILNVHLAVGEYNITAINPVTDEKSVKKLTILPRIIENEDMIVFNDSEDYFTVKLINDEGNACRMNEIVIFNVNNTIYSVKTDKNGYASLKIELNKGLYPITSTYKGYTVTNNITVFDYLHSIITINVSDINYNQKLLLNASVLPQYNNGNMTILIVGDDGYRINFTQKSDRVFTKEITGLNVSSYNVMVEFIDNANYYYSYEIAQFEVFEITPNLIVVAYDAEFGQNATITINIPQVSGNVTTKIGNKYIFTDFIPEDGVIVKRINTLEIGEYIIEVTYNGNDNYGVITKTTKLNIVKIPTEVYIDYADDVDYGESLIINITASVDGVLRVQINDDVQFINIKANEIKKLVLNNYNAGDYDILVNLTPADKHYEVSSDYGYVYIDKSKANLYVYSYNIEIGQSTDIIAKLNSNITGKVRFELNNLNYTREIINGTAILNIAGLDLGNYTVYAYFDGNTNYDDDYDWDTFEVTKISVDIDIPQSIVNEDDSITFKLPSDATGTVIMTIDDTNYKAHIIDGNVIIDLSNLTNGDYDYALHYSGDNRYSSFTIYGTLNINRDIDTIASRNMVVNFDEDYDFKATFFESDGSPLANKYIVFRIGSDEYPVKTDANGLAILNIGLAVGTYTITSINTKTDESKTNTLKIIEGIKETTIHSSDVSMNYGDGTYLIATLTDLDDRIITGMELAITINNKTVYKTTDANGQVKLLIDLKSGNYTAKITFNGNSEYRDSSKTVAVKVNKIDSYDVEIPQDIVCEDGTISFELPSDATGTVTIIINNEQYISDVVNGKVNLNISDLNNGNYPYIITYSGDNTYSSFTKTGKIEVNKLVPTIKSENMVIDYNEDYDFKATFFESDGTPLSNKYVVFIVNNTEHSVKTDVNGLAILKIGLKSGNYTITLINTKTDESKINTLIVKAVGQISIDEKDIDVPSLNGAVNGAVTIKLPADASGTITLNISGKNYNFDIVNGVANVKIPELANGNYPYTIKYSGDSKYAPFTKTGSLTVKKQTTPVKPVTKTTLTLKKVTVKRSAKKLTIQATLKVNGKAIKGKTIKFKFNKKTYKAKTNAKGIAKVTIKKAVLKKLKKGKKVTYSATYGKVTKKITVKVK